MHSTMVEIIYAPSFVRSFKKLEPALQDDVVERIELFRDEQNHEKLKVHKLQGRLGSTYSFSVNYSTRIIFSYDKKHQACLLDVGSHDVYR